MNTNNKVFVVSVIANIEGQFPFVGDKEFGTHGAAKAEFIDLCDSLSIPEPLDFSEDYFTFETADGYDFKITMKAI